jgi:hypothetical protein
MSSKIGGKSKKKRKMVAAFANAPEAEKKKIQKVSVLSETTLASIADGPQQKAQDELVIALPGASKKKKWFEKSPHGGESREGDKNGVGGGRDGTGEDEDDSMNIPLLARARTGMDMSGDGKLKGVEDVGEDAYERVSVESYGAAMLRGMGWSKGGSIGSTFSTVTEVSLAQPRAARMGLGADSELPTDGLGGVLSEENKALAKKKADKAAASAAMRKAKKEAEGKMTQGLNLFGAKPVPLDKTFSFFFFFFFFISYFFFFFFFFFMGPARSGSPCDRQGPRPVPAELPGGECLEQYGQVEAASREQEWC